MKKILVSIATTLMAATVLVACNGSGNNSNNITSEGLNLSKAVCTSSKNWKEVGIGMTAGQVEERLGKPIKIVSTLTTTTYNYERCRGFLKITAEGTPATLTTPAKPPTYVITDVGGVVVLTANRGVTAVTSPERIEALTVCELDYFNYPYDSIYTYSPEDGYALRDNCRADNNQF